MTPETRTFMQHRDGLDTEQIQALVRAFWSLENAARPFPHLRATVQPIQDDLEVLVQVLRDDAVKNHRKPFNRVAPREPIPAPNDGKGHNVPMAEQDHAPAGKLRRHIPCALTAVEEASRFRNRPKVVVIHKGDNSEL